MNTKIYHLPSDIKVFGFVVNSFPQAPFGRNEGWMNSSRWLATDRSLYMVAQAR